MNTIFQHYNIMSHVNNIMSISTFLVEYGHSSSSGIGHETNINLCEFSVIVIISLSWQNNLSPVISKKSLYIVGIRIHEIAL